MKKHLFSLAMLSCSPLIADFCCEPPPPPEPDCYQHLFVERKQFFLNAEFLYWNVVEGSVDYAVKMNSIPEASPTFAIGDYKSATFDWRPGFRLAAYWYNRPHYWEIKGEYTWFSCAGSNQVHSPSNPAEFLNPTWDTGRKGPYSEAESHIHLNYQLGNFEVARVFDPNPHLRMRLLGGLTTGFLEQTWHLEYTNFIPEVSKIENKWRYWGGGIRLGVTADWFWGNQIYLTGKTTLAPLLGRYKNHVHNTAEASGIVLQDSTFEDTRFAFHSQFLLGPSWQVPSDCWSFELFAGYEFNIWFNLHETIRTSRGPDSSPIVSLISPALLGFHGLTLRLTFGF